MPSLSQYNFVYLEAQCLLDRWATGACDSNLDFQRVLSLLCYPGAQFVPNQALWRIYGGGASVDAQQDPAAIDKQVSESLLNDVVKQLNTPQPALSPNTPWRVMGLFPSSCLVCRATGVCGLISCAEKVRTILLYMSFSMIMLNF